MSLARQLSTYDRNLEGSAAPALPSVEREPRTYARPRVAKAKKSVAGILFASLGWVAVLVLSLFVVHRNTMVLAETNALTGKQQALAQLEQQIQEKSSMVNVPIEKVEGWAKAHNMKRPTTVKAVAVDPNAVAPAPQPQAVAVAEPAPKAEGIFGAVKGFFARFAAARAALAGASN